MLSLLIKIFIKDYENVKDREVREKYGILAGGYGIFLNLLLFAGKYFAGVISGSIAMTADAFNNLSDAGSSIIAVIGFKMSGQKPDTNHPFGHGRIEYLSGLGVSAIIVIMGFELVKSSVMKIIHPEEISLSIVSAGILIASILVKIYMSFYCRQIGRKIESATLMATSTDALSDTVATTAVLITSIIGVVFNIKIDGICGTLVGLLILFAGIKAAKETIDPLLGLPPEKEFVDKIHDIVMSYPEILGVHDLVVHDYGPGRVMISLHAEVDEKSAMNEIHDVIDNAEYQLYKELSCHAVIHMDPIAVGDERVDELKRMVRDTVKSYESKMTIHDFRVVFGPSHTNLIFDVIASFDDKRSDETIQNDLGKLIKEKREECLCVITVDRSYVDDYELS